MYGETRVGKSATNWPTVPAPAVTDEYGTLGGMRISRGNLTTSSTTDPTWSGLGIELEPTQEEASDCPGVDSHYYPCFSPASCEQKAQCICPRPLSKDHERIILK
jgi:hypothetical protein